MARFPMDMHHCAENVCIKLTILVTPIKLHTKIFLISLDLVNRKPQGRNRTIYKVQKNVLYNKPAVL